MPILQIVDTIRYDTKALYNVINYVAREDKCQCRCIGATNIYLDQSDIVNTINDHFMKLWEYHCKTKGKFAQHLIIELAPSEVKYLTADSVLCLAYRFAQKEFPNLICYFAVHDHALYHDEHNNLLPRFHIDMIVFLLDIFSGRIAGFHKGAEYKMLFDFIALLNQFVQDEDIQRNKSFVKNGRTNHHFY